MTTLRIRCPATTANLGPGFDSLGLAFDQANLFEIAPCSGFELSAEGPGAELVPTEPEGHAVVSAYQATRAALGLGPVSGLRIHAQIWAPPARGLGSSATATAAGILAAEAHAERWLEEPERLALATRLEGHPDNVVPCLLGGMCVSIAARGEGSGSGLVVERFGIAVPPAFVVAIPSGVELSTATMREALPAQVSHGDAVATAGRAGLLIAALLLNRREALRRALEDWLHEPYRGRHIPGLESVRRAAREAGAYGVVISGSGPTLLALSEHGAAAEIARTLVHAWEEVGVSAEAHVLEIDSLGARILGAPAGQSTGA